MKRIIFSTIFILLFTLPLLAQRSTWAFDKSHTNIGFSISYMTISDVTGRFTEFEGKVTTTLDDFSDANIDVDVDVASITTEDEKRDSHLRSADFFDTKKYPKMTFTSKSFKKTGNKTYKITGDLTIKDKTKEVVLDAELKGVIKDPWGKTRAGFKATTSIDRYDYDVVWNKTLESGGLLVSKTVDIIINAELIKE
jgi:polyisoprenoid-binding protein YceI